MQAEPNYIMEKDAKIDQLERQVVAANEKMMAEDTAHKQQIETLQLAKQSLITRNVTNLNHIVVRLENFKNRLDRSKCEAVKLQQSEDIRHETHKSVLEKAISELDEKHWELEGRNVELEETVSKLEKRLLAINQALTN
jgi:hypothetical protein